MAGSIAITKPQPRLSDPGESQRPLMFYAEIVRRHGFMIVLLSILLTTLVVLACALLPPVSTGSATIAIDRQAAPETIGDDRLLSTGDDQFMATQQGLLRADTILRPVAERYNLLQREHQFRRYGFWHYSWEKERAIRNAPIVLRHLTIERTPNTYLLTITYRDREPRVAAEVANAIADSYLKNIFETRIKEAGRLTSSMERQLIDLKEKMESTHRALMVYQRDLGTADPEQKTSVLVAKLQALNTESSVAEADRIAKEAIFREAKDGSLPEVEVSGQSIDLAHDVEKLQVAKANLALAAATYGDQHPEYRKAAAQVEEARAALDESRQNVSTRIGVDYRQTLIRERMLSAAVAETKQQVDDLTSQSFDYLELKHEADTAERVYEDLFAKIKQSGINSELQNNIIRLADSARPAATPIFPDWPLIVALSMGFFTLLLTVYVISIELTDFTAREPETVEKALGIPVVCSLPQVTNMQLRLALGPDGMRIAGARWHGLKGGFFDEGVRHLRGYLMLSPQARVSRSVLITSALPGEGKSTLALSLAMVNAEQGKRTLLIDADLRQPAIERLLRMEPDAGLAEVLAHTSHWSTATRPVPGRPNLSVLGSGIPLPLALALIGPQMRGILMQAVKEFDLVVLDSPPLLGCAETLELAAAADVAVLAVRSGQTPMKALGGAVETLRRVHVPIAGIVLNESAIMTDVTYKAYARYYSTLGSA
ncbi:MAG: P-loop NTPase [Acidobacteriaceae bacterium]|jgi:succinoglycan biosynthesis transport protein ExoP